jgi:RNA polymerase sigma factor (sigma-70 family)
MATTKISDLVRTLTRRITAGTLSKEPDRELVERFLARQEAAAFEALVQRHGPMVYRVCWRVLQHRQDTEDAFQATFLLLAHKLQTVRNWHSLASWLHGVAHRVALKAKGRAATRLRHERRAAVSEILTPDDITWKELRTALDVELRGLPERLRLPLILCYLEGRTQDEAAAQLGWSKSTLFRRLDEARSALGRRLSRKGLVWPAALSPVLLSDCISSTAPPPELMAGTVNAVACVAAGREAATTVVSAKVGELTEGVLKIMLHARLKIIAVVLLALPLAWLSAGLLARPGAAPQAGPPPQARAEEANPTAADRYGDPLPAGAVARLGTTRLRHGSSVYFVAFLAEGKQVLSAGEDGVVRLWDVATGEEVHHFSAPKKRSAANDAHAPPPDSTVALSPDGKTLATCDGDDPVRFWDTTSGRETSQVSGIKKALTGDIAALALAPDGKTLAVASPCGPLLLWDLTTGKELRRIVGNLIEDNPAVNSKIMTYAPNGPAGSGQGIWSERARPHLAFSGDGKLLLSAMLGLDGHSIKPVVDLWDLSAGKELSHVKPGEQGIVVAAGLSPDGKTVAWVDQTANDGGAVHLMETATGKELHRLPAGGSAKYIGEKVADRFPGALTRFAFAPNGRTLITRPAGGQVVQWDVETGKEQLRLGKPLPPPSWWGGMSYLTPPGMAISPDGKMLAVAGDGNELTLLNLKTGQELHPKRGQAAGIVSARYTSDGKSITSLGSDGSIRTWEAATAQQLGVSRVLDGALTLALSPNGQLVASAGIDGKVRLQEAKTGKELATVSTYYHGPLRLALSPDLKTLAVGGSSSPVVRLYDIGTGKETHALQPEGIKDEPDGAIIVPFRSAPAPSFSPDGKFLALPGRCVLYIWNAATGELVRSLALPPDRAVGLAVFAPDGRSVALDMQDGTVALWDLTTGKRIRVFESGWLIAPKPPQGGPPGRAAPLAPADPVLLWHFRRTAAFWLTTRAGKSSSGTSTRGKNWTG